MKAASFEIAYGKYSKVCQPFSNEHPNHFRFAEVKEHANSQAVGLL